MTVSINTEAKGATILFEEKKLIPISLSFWVSWPVHAILHGIRAKRSEFKPRLAQFK